MSGVEWVDALPEIHHHGGGPPRVWEPLLAPLLERPGVWALVRTTPTAGGARTTASLLRRREKIRLPDGRWEFASRKTDGGGAVYARYLGPTDEAAS